MGISPYLECISKQEDLVLTVDSSLVINSDPSDFRIEKVKYPFYWVDPNFRDWDLDEYRWIESTTHVAVYRATSGILTLDQIFNNLENDVVSQRDIIEFCIKYPEWLGQGEILTYFLIEENNQFFMPNLGVYSFGTRVRLKKYPSNQVVDMKKIRVVLPLR